MIKNYLKTAWRNLRKNKMYSVINITGLAIGLACCLAIGLFVADEFSYDKFHKNYRNIYRVVETQKQADGIYNVAVTPGPLALALSKDFPEVKQATRIGNMNGLLTLGQKAIETNHIVSADSAFFSLFSFPLVLGNINKIFLGPDEVVLSEAMAERFFGPDWRRKEILGQSFQLDNKHTLILTGVIQNAPDHSGIQFDALLPFKYEERYNKRAHAWNSNNYFTYVHLQPGTDMGEFRKKISSHLQRYSSEVSSTLVMQPLRDIYLKSTFDFKTDWGKRSDIVYVRIFITVGLIVLLIAIVNFINLSTARASERAREVGVRKAIGAERSSLITQFLAESFLMTGIAVITGLVLLYSLLPLLNSLSGKNIIVPYQQPFFWITLTGFTLLVGFLSGLYPAFYLSSFRPIRVLKGIFDIRSGRRFRQSLVVGQFVLSIVLVIGTFIIYRQLGFIQNKKLGFDKSQLLYVRLKGDVKDKEGLFKQDLQNLPGVEKVAATSATLVDVTSSTIGIEWQGQVPKDNFLIYQMTVDADFIPATGMSLVSGRNFSEKIISDTSQVNAAYLVNEAAVKRMGYTASSAVGKKVKLWGTDGEIIGIVKDFHYRSLKSSIEPFIFCFWPGKNYSSLFIKARPGTLQNTLGDIEKLYKQYESKYPISYGFVDQDLERLYQAEQRTGQIILYFSILTILVSCLGLFGLATFTTGQRIKEIGIRKVLGASVTGIVTLLSKDFLKLVLLAFIIAAPVAWYVMNRWLQDFAYQVDIKWWIFILAGSIAIVIAFMTISFQAIKTAIANPVRSLRAE
jgi:putative ABC transport system permease protein